MKFPERIEVDESGQYRSEVDELKTDNIEAKTREKAGQVKNNSNHESTQTQPRIENAQKEFQAPPQAHTQPANDIPTASPDSQGMNFTPGMHQPVILSRGIY